MEEKSSKLKKLLIALVLIIAVEIGILVMVDQYEKDKMADPIAENGSSAAVEEAGFSADGLAGTIDFLTAED